MPKVVIDQKSADFIIHMVVKTGQWTVDDAAKALSLNAGTITNMIYRSGYQKSGRSKGSGWIKKGKGDIKDVWQ